MVQKDHCSMEIERMNVRMFSLESERSWDAVASFCEEVISQKEAQEREREHDPLAPPLRRRRVGRRRRQFAAALLPTPQV
ncbi:hypothetical protein RR48_12640 [Papilio machaon]|uniref:Uncharacterized protein n=1 Tax=Papilio machaon TaxID=76193 RepID=A0A194QQL5_PAPMA|nr:hypothetical protein RR48_12640 [Papilio machaon]